MKKRESGCLPELLFVAASVPVVLKMGRFWPFDGDWPPLAGLKFDAGEPELGTGDFRPESRNKFAFRGVGKRHSLSRRDLWRDFESLEMRPKRPKKNSNAMALGLSSATEYHFLSLSLSLSLWLNSTFGF